jgi:hypothetical protein
MKVQWNGAFPSTPTQFFHGDRFLSAAATRPVLA